MRTRAPRHGTDTGTRRESAPARKKRFALRPLLLFPFLVVALASSGCLSKLHTPWIGGDPDTALRRASSRGAAGLAVPAVHSAPGPRSMLVLEPRRSLARHDVSDLSFRSSGSPGRRDYEVRGRYFHSRAPGRKGLVIVLPIWGASIYPTKVTARRLVKDDPEGEINVVALLEKESLIPWGLLGESATEEELRSGARLAVGRVLATVEDIRHVVDWAVERPEIDPDRIAIVGFSFSAVVASLTMGMDRRVDSGVFVMGGSNLHEGFASCSSKSGKARRAALARMGIGANSFERLLEAPLAPVNPKFYVTSVNPAKILVVEAGRDTCLPADSRRDFWNALGRPERIVIDAGHRRAFLAMTFLDGHWATRRISEFLHRKLTPRTAPMALASSY